MVDTLAADVAEVVEEATEEETQELLYAVEEVAVNSAAMEATCYAAPADAIPTAAKGTKHADALEGSLPNIHL